MIIILFKMFYYTDIYTILFFIFLIIGIIFLFFAFLTGNWWFLIISSGFILCDIFPLYIVNIISR